MDKQAQDNVRALHEHLKQVADIIQALGGVFPV